MENKRKSGMPWWMKLGVRVVLYSVVGPLLGEALGSVITVIDWDAVAQNAGVD